MIVALTFTLFLSSLQAQNKASAPPVKPKATNDVPSNRFLFVVDTSASMKKHAADSTKAVEGIIRDSASGQLHRGDTLGMWTFNSDLHTGLYALQTWLPENLDEISLMTLEFLKQQKYVGASRFDMAVAGVLEVVRRSDIITVFIISNGEGRMQGTPFDNDINALYDRIQSDNKHSHMPVVTVLQGKGGRLIRYTANVLPWPVVIPEVPIAIKMPGSEAGAKTVAEKAPEASKTPAPAVAAVTNATQTVQPKVATPSATPAAVTAVQPPPIANPAPPPQTVPTPATAPVEARQQPEHANLMPHPANAPLSAKPGPPPSQPEEIAAEQPKMNPPIRQAPAQSKPPPLTAPPQQAAASPPMSGTGKTPAAASKTHGTNSNAANTTAAAVASGPMNRSKIYLISGAAMLGLAVVLIIRLVIRGRAYRPSLISNTMGGPPKR